MSPPQEGYAALAAHLEHKTAGPILRRFGALNVLNLLYMQAELFHLERELRAIAKEDAEAAESPRTDFAYSMLELRDSIGEGKGKGQGFQWEKVLEIRARLGEYSRFYV